jgi:hypothetical protein
VVPLYNIRVAAISYLVNSHKFRNNNILNSIGFPLMLKALGNQLPKLPRFGGHVELRVPAVRLIRDDLDHGLSILNF